MKKNKKILIITGVSIIIIALLTTIYIVLTTPDKETTLTAIEKRYVTKNKNNVMNIAVPNDIPVFGYQGKGVFFDFIDDFTNDIELSLNKVSYNTNEEPSLYDYKFEVTNNVNENQILVYEDYYVALSTKNNKLTKLEDLSKMNIGCLKNKLDNVTYYLNSIDVSFTEKDNVDELLNGLEKSEYDIVVIPYMMYFNNILKNKYNIIYNFNDLKENYCLTLSENNDTVNTILKKYFDLWKQKDYIESYNDAYRSLYYTVKNIKSKEQAELVGKIYNYGYVKNLPFENVVNNNLVGINGEYINNFAILTDSEFRYKKYNSISDLIKAFNDGEVDIIFNNFNSNNKLTDAYQTLSTYKENYVVLANIKNNQIMDSIKSLKNKTVYALEDSDIANYVKINSEAKLKTFKNYNVLLNNLKEDMIIVMDYDVYNYYKNNELKNYYIVYENNFNNSYNFIIKNNNSNSTLVQMFNDFISSQNYDYIKTTAYQNMIINPKNETLAQTFLNYLLFVVLPLVILIVILVIIFKKKKEKNIIKKDEKLRYVDMLTSLKNRNYLNANINEWDKAKIYPQTIIIIDLNNIKYINDNFGHEEGDNVIKSAANILIKTQLENSDIIRTDGNEFLIYLIGYKEDQIVSYMRKLYKAMKDLPHGHGAAFGYSMIEDDMKLLDDAINEATLDMRTNKES